METHKAYRIDAYRNIVEEVAIGDYKDLYKNIGCHCFCVAATLPNRDTLYVDDEGYLNGKVTRGFIFNGRFFAGNGVLLGSDAEGESKSVKTKILDAANLVTFAPVGFEITDDIRERAMNSCKVTKF